MRSWLIFAVVFVAADTAHAYISQVDGQVLPISGRLQSCLDGPNGEASSGDLSAVVDARILPNAFRPVEDPVGSGQYPVTFQMIAEGAGFRNVFGYYWVDEDVTDPNNLHMVFDCRPDGTCNCPCDDPTDMRDADGSPTSWDRTIDFANEAGFVEGRAIGFFIRTPEQLDGTRVNGANCGPPSMANQNHRTYFTSQALNDDGDFVHFLIYESLIVNTYYFGFEDLFRGGDNDFEDVLAKVTGLVPTCVPDLEQCNNLDDDCDQIIDEDVTRACNEGCGPGVETCSMGSFGACSAPTPTTETCNGVDDDCNGNIDEGLFGSCMNECGTGQTVCVMGSFVDCSAPTPDIEICNNADDDCDGMTDEMLTQACFSECGSGVETCSAGSFSGCTAPAPSMETCNATDDDCDGRTDEMLTQGCMTECGMGTEVCISGTFVGCTAPAPALEACNGLDDDCDGMVDEDLSRTCSTACGTGNEVCVAGDWANCDAPVPGVEVCNNLDDDCDGVIDDGNPGGGDMCLPNTDGGFTVVTDPPTAEDRCVPGRVRCIAGELECRGATSPSTEICNCEDDDCDGMIDEDGSGLCPGQGACVDCACLTPCDNDEFPCPPGRICDRTLADPEQDVIGYCVAGRCADVECSEQEVCDPNTGGCINLCESIDCLDGFACIRGICVEDNCYGRGCAASERCIGGACEADPCDDVECDEMSFCSEGECVEVCVTSCEQGFECRAGECVEAPCGGCSPMESCVDGACVLDDCSVRCGTGRICQGTECVDDLCEHVECPGETFCIDGQCFSDEPPPAAQPVLGLATGGGGCACDAAGRGGAPTLPAGLGLLLFGLLLGWRRKRTIRLLRWLPLGLLVLSGCDVDPFCLENCGEEVDSGTGTGRPDAQAEDGCVPTGMEEECNGRDDDCDGLFDEEFDTESDPRNCGECGAECVIVGAFPACEEGICVVDRCEIGFHDLNENGTDGCEYACLESGEEICDDRDNDCDGDFDEGIDVSSDAANCGVCGNICAFANAAASCVESECVMGDCNAGFVDANADPDDGCELACEPSGDEVCNDADDDCDGTIDEGFDLQTDIAHCGRCNRACSFTNGVGACSLGMCSMVDCVGDFHDIDMLPTTGCEYACTPTGNESCNGMDDDCDGAVDESDPMVGMPCGEDEGECELGVFACQLGRRVCIGGNQGTPEVCNGLDDDCDGTPDNGSMPGVGERCGETNVGPCEFGTTVCSGGMITCGGGYMPPATSEACNGIDDDCDGAVDDNPTGPASTPTSCQQTQGVCAGRMQRCDGSGGWVCDFPDTFQSSESICDGLDNDCNGTGDEGCLTVQPASDVRVDVGDGVGNNNSVQVSVSGDDGDNVYAVWMDLRGAGDAHVLYSRSPDAGDSWQGTPAQIDAVRGPAIGPQIGVTDGGADIAVVWSDFHTSRSACTDSGDCDPFETCNGSDECVSSYRQIYGRFSDDRGGSFAAEDYLNPGQDDSFGVDVAVSGANVYAVFESFTTERNRHVFLVSSTNGGSSWSGPVQVDQMGDGGDFVAATPRVEAVGSTVHVVWRDNRNGGLDVYYNRSTDGGASFAAMDTRIDTGTTAGSDTSFSPAIAADSTGNVWIVWVDDRSGDSFDIHFNRSGNSGASWLGSAVNIDDDPLPHDSIEPQIATVGDGEFVVAWVDFRSGFSDIIARRSGNAGATFTDAARVDTGTARGTSGSFDVSLAANGNLVGIAWADSRDGLLDIYASFSLDGGANWQPQDYRMDSTGLPGSSDSERPKVYVSADAVHVLWVDHRDGANGDIYSRRLAP